MGPNSNEDSLTQLESRLVSRDGVTLTRDEPLAARTTLRIGGNAELFARLSTESALAELLDQSFELRVPFRILGLGSNVLLPDEGLEGLTAVLEGDFLEMSFDGLAVKAGAGLALARVARSAVEEGLQGLEALAGFPSTVGGAVVMNAGCYGVEIKDILKSTTVLRPGGKKDVLGVADLDPGYRSTNLQGTDVVVASAVFELRRDPDGHAGDRLTALNRKRRESMPSGKPNAGSVFKNPAGDFAGRLIESCGLKGEQIGGAQISEVHANVIVNNGGATAADVLELMRIMFARVSRQFQVELEPELILAGNLRGRWNRMIKPG